MSDKLEKAEKRIAELEREKRGVEEMLFQVLNAVAEPVEVPVETLKAGIENDKMIDVVLHEDINAWVFRVVSINEQ